jgi:hypothetical protein
MADPTKPQLKNITVNRLPADVVIDYKTLAVRLDCTVEELTELVLRDAIKKGDRWLPEVYRLRVAKKKEKADNEVVRKQLEKLVPKVKELSQCQG